MIVLVLCLRTLAILNIRIGELTGIPRCGFLGFHPMFATEPHQGSSCCKSSCGCTNMCFNLLSFNFCKKTIFVCLTRKRWFAIYGAWDLVLEIFTTAIYRQLHSSNDIRDRERDASMIAIEDLKATIRDAESSPDQHHSHTGKKDGQHNFADSNVPSSTLCCFHLLLPHRVTLSECSPRLWTTFPRVTFI